MSRDFTYIDDLVRGMRLLMDVIPGNFRIPELKRVLNDSKSTVAPFRVVNIGNNQPTKLSDFILAIEDSVGIKSVENFMPIQAGDVPETWADTTLLEKLTGYKPNMDLSDGVRNFVSWYRVYYDV